MVSCLDRSLLNGNAMIRLIYNRLYRAMRIAMQACCPRRLLAAGQLVVLILFVSIQTIRAEDKQATFYRGINLYGPALTIDGHKWDGNDAKEFSCVGQGFENQAVELRPPTDENRARMLRSSRWGNPIQIELTNVPAGVYQVCLYVWEDNDSTHFNIVLNDQTVIEKFDSRGAGIWKKLGPWTVQATDGKIRLSSTGGDANLSGLEIWAGAGPIPGGSAAGFVSQPSTEQTAFFESKIRPLLAMHCYECHSANAKKIGGGLLVDSRAGMLHGGDTEPPVVPGDTDASLLITAVRHTDPGLKMPPKKKLSAMEIADLETWVKLGMPDPRIEDTVTAVKSKYAIDWKQSREFWSFRPVTSPAAPVVRDTAWPTNDIDRFVLSRLEREGLQPTGDAERATLIRRATYDLIGLPPTPEEIDAFVKDSSPNAFASVVDRLLASPRYGERWGRYWLDVVRYSDTAGDNSDFPIPQMYLYRNWVISAFNRDLPYNQFVREQLAGDLLVSKDAAETRERIIATGYIANARRFGSTVDDYPQHLTIEDTLDNLGRAFLGLTINCARCHNHKFDPITAEDYYGLYGIFRSTRYPWPGIELEQKQRDLAPLVSATEFVAAMKAQKEKSEQFKSEVARLEKELKDAKGDDRKQRDQQLQDARKAAEAFARLPLPVEQAYAVGEGAKIEDAFVQLKGEPAKRGPLVRRRFPTILGGTELSAENRTSGRLQLADWIVEPQNPLTARVLVNRLWLYHFGKGLVSTPNDFGRQGKSPSHPELLDWLASRFVESGWSIKSMHRTIMLSRTYCLASIKLEANQDRDPGNDFYSHFSSRRLDAEAIRDTLLVLGGNLDLAVGGPHPFPPQTEWKFTQHNPFKAVYETNHRSVYLMTQRIQRHPYLSIFDGPDSAVSTPQRLTSTTPLQALYLLNDPFVHQQSQRFAAWVLAESLDDSIRMDRAYRRMFGRLPESEERQAGLEFLKQMRDTLKGAGVAADQVEPQAWQAFTRAMFRFNEFVYVD
jgi:hypothetical protein